MHKSIDTLFIVEPTAPLYECDAEDGTQAFQLEYDAITHHNKLDGYAIITCWQRKGDGYETRPLSDCGQAWLKTSSRARR